MHRIKYIIIILTIVSCSHLQNDNSAPNSIRTHQLLDKQIEVVSDKIDREYFSNPTTGAEAYNKSNFILLRTEWQNDYVFFDTLPQPYKIALLEDFSNNIDSLNISDPYLDDLKDNHIGFWLENRVINDQDSYAILTDLKILKLYVLNVLYRTIRSKDYNFNMLRPIVIDSSSSIYAGEIYEAQICFTAFDTTRWPEIIIDGEFIEVQENGYGVLRYKSNRPGEKIFQGRMLFPNNNFELDTFKFEKKIYIK